MMYWGEVVGVIPNGIFDSPWLVAVGVGVIELVVMRLFRWWRKLSGWGRGWWWWPAAGLLPLISGVLMVWLYPFGPITSEYLIWVFAIPFVMWEKAGELPPVWVVWGSEAVWLMMVFTVLVLALRYLMRKLLKVNGEFSGGEVVMSVGTGVVGTMLLYFGLMTLDWSCNSKAYGFHVMNAHLKDVCSDEKWQEQCPKSSEDLRNYDRVAYDDLRSCMKVRYYLDDVGHGTLMVRYGGMVLVSDGRLYDRWSMYYLDAVDKERAYPPAMSGRWKLVK